MAVSVPVPGLGLVYHFPCLFDKSKFEVDGLDECADTFCRGGFVTNMCTIVITVNTLLLLACFIAPRLHCLFRTTTTTTN
jgi:hypothetical protein